MISNSCIDAALDELHAVGIEPELSTGGKHAAITWKTNGKNRKFCTAISPSDWRAPMNVRRDVRKMLREDGFIKEDKETDNVQELVHQPHLFLNNGGAYCTSLDIAAHFGRQHKNVLQSIQGILDNLGSEFGRLNFQPTTYITEQNKEFKAYNLTRDGFTLLTMGFTGPQAMEWKVKYLTAFNQMEAELRSLAAPQLPQQNVALSKETTTRIERLENDLNALTELFFQSNHTPLPPKEGFTVIPSFYRKSKYSKRK